MPIYESMCSKCKKLHEYVSKVSERNKTPRCCNKATEKRIFSAPISHFDIQPWDSFVSPSTGKVITSKAQRREDMKASGCRDWEGIASEKQLAAQRKKDQDAAEDKSLTETAKKVIAQLPPEKKKILLDN